MPDKSTVSPVQFHFLQKSSLPKERRRLKAFIASIFKKEKTALESVSYIFCSDDYLLGINQQFLKHNYYTDIISFNLATRGAPVEGEIYISLDRVRDNAKTLDQSYQIELHRVIFHGVLHFCGYKDKLAGDIRLMRKKEEQYIRAYFQ